MANCSSLARSSAIVSYEAIRQWCRRFGSEYARRLKKKAPRSATLVDCKKLLEVGAWCQYNPLEGDIADRGCVGESVWPIKVG